MNNLRPPRSRDLLVELAAEVNGAGNGLKVGEVDLAKLVVAGNLESTVDLGELGHADVGELVVVVEDQVTGLGQVGGAEGLELVTPEAELTGQLLEGGNGDGRDVAEGHVATAGKVGELDLQRLHVSGEVDQTTGVLQVVHVDGLEGKVLGDVEGTDGLQGDTVEVGQTSVGDRDVVGLGDTLVEVEVLQLGKGSPLDGSNLVERAEAEGGESGEAVQLEGVTNGAQARGSQGAQVVGTVDGERAGDFLDTVDVEVTGDVLADLDVTLEGLAAGVLVGIALAFDRDGLAAATV